jgi:DNA invertase Pin-like site-specific DNA recombinase
MCDKAGRWFRVSTGKQDEDNQVPDVDVWCDSHDYDVAQTYILHGKSAFKRSKQFDHVWAQALADMRSGRITVLVVWKTDRMPRQLNTIHMIKEAVEAGGRLRPGLPGRRRDRPVHAGDRGRHDPCAPR